MRQHPFLSYRLKGFHQKLRHCDRVAVIYSVCYCISCKPMWAIKSSFILCEKYIFSATNLKEKSMLFKAYCTFIFHVSAMKHGLHAY